MFLFDSKRETVSESRLFLRKLVGWCCAALLCTESVLAQEAGGVSLRFEIKRFWAENNTLIADDVIERTLKEFTGPDRDFGTVQQALEALEKLYADAGYGAVQVLLPEQELDRGEVHFHVIEGKIVKVSVEGNKHFDEENIRSSLGDTLTLGKTPNVNKLADNLRLQNESPAKQTTVVMRAGEEEGEVEAVVRTTDQHPFRTAVTLDNTGTPKTGIFRMGLAAQYANAFNRDHIFSAQFVTSPDNHHRQVFVTGLSYHVPFYGLNSSLDVFAGYSNVDSGQFNTTAGNFLIAGSGSVFGLRYNQNLPKGKSDWEQKLSFGYDFRAYQAQVFFVGSNKNLVPDVTVHPISLTYIANTKRPDTDFSGYFSVVHNLPGGNDGNDEAFQRTGARPGANSRYMLFRYGINWLKLLPSDWQMRVNFTGQDTGQKLVSGEQFGVGGADSVRGFLEREISNDKGHRGSLEFYTPDMGKTLIDGGRLRAVGFYDFGYVKRIQPAAGEANGYGVSSFGFGLRGGLGKDIGFRLDYARVIDRGPVPIRNMRMHGAFSWVF